MGVAGSMVVVAAVAVVKSGMEVALAEVVKFCVEVAAAAVVKSGAQLSLNTRYCPALHVTIASRLSTAAALAARRNCPTTAPRTSIVTQDRPAAIVAHQRPAPARSAHGRSQCLR